MSKIGKLFILVLSVFTPLTSLAWNDCPYNETNCTSPGLCSDYIDTDNDGICDHSQSAPADRDNSITNSEIISGDVENTTYNIHESELKTKTVGEIAKINNKKTERTYHALPITLFLIVLYFISFILSKLKIISLIAHKKIWNVFLLIAFLVSGFSGMLLIIRLNSNFVIPWPFNLLFWHVETGIAMFIISLFHIIERRTYFKNMFLKKK